MVGGSPLRADDGDKTRAGCGHCITKVMVANMSHREKSKLAMFFALWESGVLITNQIGQLNAMEVHQNLILYGLVAPSVIEVMIGFIGWMLRIFGTR